MVRPGPAVLMLVVEQWSWWTKIRSARGRLAYALSEVVPMGERTRSGCCEGWIMYNNMPATVRRA